MMLARLVSVLVVASSVALAAGCGGRSIGDDLNARPTNPPEPTPPDPIDPPQCATIAPACDPGDRAVANEASCGRAAYCYSRTEACSQAVVWCAHDETVQCTAVPVCDGGDKPVTACPPNGGPGSGLTCYSRSACGSTIQCLHADACKTLPQCSAGDVEVTAIDTCSKPGVDCYAVTACNFTIHCYTP